MALIPVLIGSRTGCRSITPGANPLNRKQLRAFHWATIVDGHAESVHHAANHPIAHRHTHDLAGSLYLVAFAQLCIVTQQHCTYLILFEVHGQTRDAVRKIKQFARHGLLEAVNARNTITERDDRTNLVHLDCCVVVLYLLAQ